MSDTDDPLRLNRLTELVTTPRLPIGAQVLVQETGEIFFSAGNTTAEIAARLGWTQPNIWLPDHTERYIRENHPEFPDPLPAIRLILTQPRSVHRVETEADQIRFFAEAGPLRAAGLLRSRSATGADVLVELRSANGERYPRVFHLSPMRRPRGVQLWP